MEEIQKTGLFGGGSEWEESKHPRDGEGKFAASAGGESMESLREKERLDYIEEKENASRMPEDITELMGAEFKGYKGQQAVDKLLQEKQGHIKAAFHREDIGDIDLIWGDEGCGLMHILMRREEQGIDTNDFVLDLTNVVENGEFQRKNEKGTFEFWHKGRIAVISPELRGNKLTFLLTAYKNRKKKITHN